VKPCVAAPTTPVFIEIRLRNRGTFLRIYFRLLFGEGKPSRFHSQRGDDGYGSNKELDTLRWHNRSSRDALPLTPGVVRTPEGKLNLTARRRT